jgi:hypothetical protein
MCPFLISNVLLFRTCIGLLGFYFCFLNGIVTSIYARLEKKHAFGTTLLSYESHSHDIRRENTIIFFKMPKMHDFYSNLIVP